MWLWNGTIWHILYNIINRLTFPALVLLPRPSLTTAEQTAAQINEIYYIAKQKRTEKQQ